jgi:hypothetical protein
MSAKSVEYWHWGEAGESGEFFISSEKIEGSNSQGVSLGKIYAEIPA